MIVGLEQYLRGGIKLEEIAISEILVAAMASESSAKASDVRRLF